MGNFLIGSFRARIDRGGRLKIPERFRTALEEEYGNDVFITSLTDESIQIYPLSEWDKLTGVTTEGTTSLKPSVRNFLVRVNRLGTRYTIDSKGRVLLSQVLREKAKLGEDVEVIGLSNHLEVWNREILDEKLKEKPVTDEDFEIISELKLQGNSK